MGSRDGAVGPACDDGPTGRRRGPASRAPVLLIGAFGDYRAEGLANVARRIAVEVAKTNPVQTWRPRDVLSPTCWSSTLRARPHVIHYVSGPTLAGLVVLFLLRSVTGARPSCPLPGLISPRSDATWPGGSFPISVLTQSRRWATLFEGLGARCAFLPNGVDLGRFRPLPARERDTLRGRLGWGGETVLLHVGHLRESRNLRVLAPLVSPGRRVVVVASPDLSVDERLVQDLESAGVEIVRDFHPRIEELYQAADGYLFPVADLPDGSFPGSLDEIGVIDMPLSALEACAAGLPVLTTRFGGLPLVLVDRESCLYVEPTADGLQRGLDALSQGASLDPRAAVSDLDWESIGRRIVDWYDVLAGVHEGAAC